MIRNKGKEQITLRKWFYVRWYCQLFSIYNFLWLVGYLFYFFWGTLWVLNMRVSRHIYAVIFGILICLTHVSKKIFTLEDTAPFILPSWLDNFSLLPSCKLSLHPPSCLRIECYRECLSPCLTVRHADPDTLYSVYINTHQTVFTKSRFLHTLNHQKPRITFAYRPDQQCPHTHTWTLATTQPPTPPSPTHSL